VYSAPATSDRKRILCDRKSDLFASGFDCITLLATIFGDLKSWDLQSNNVYNEGRNEGKQYTGKKRNILVERRLRECIHDCRFKCNELRLILSINLVVI
ncbi:hypothetical protein L9F63_007620, partial [Diploptera punctata]